MTTATCTLSFTAMPINTLIPTPEIFLGLFTKSRDVETLNMAEYAKSLGMTFTQFFDELKKISEKQITIENMAGQHCTNEMGFLNGYYLLENGMAVNKKFEDLGIIGIYPGTINSTFSYGDDQWGEEAIAAREYWSGLRNKAYDRRDKLKAKIRFERNLGYEITDEAATFLRKNSNYNKNFFSSEIPTRLILKSEEFKTGKKKAMYLSLADQYKNWATGNSNYNMPWSMKQAKMAYEIAFPSIR